MGLVLSPRLCVQKGFSGYPDLHCVRKYGSVLGEMIYDPIGPTYPHAFYTYILCLLYYVRLTFGHLRFIHIFCTLYVPLPI